MIGKVNAACNSLAGRTRKETFESRSKQQVPSSNSKRTKPSSLDVVLDNRGTTIVTVKTKGRKGSSIMVSSGSSGTKAIDDRKPPGGITDSQPGHWSRTLTEQNPALKQGLQQLAGHMQSSKHSRNPNSIRKEMKSIGETRKSTKHMPQDKMILDEIPVKQAAKMSSDYPKAAPNSAVPSTTTIASSLVSVEVWDRGVQCGFDSRDKFGEFNPVGTLEFLMKEMEGLVKDERSSEILTEMEQALYRIPRELGEAAPANLEAHAKLEAITATMTATSKKLEASCTKLRKDKESLQQQVNKQAGLLEEAQQYRRNLENLVQQLNAKLNESQQRERNLESAVKQMSVELKESVRTISELNEKTKGVQVLQKLITDLQRERDEQLEAAQQNYMEVQYLKVENEKLITLSSYKDTRLAELESALKDLKNHISELYMNHIREAGERAKDANNQQVSIIHGGAACSSPTSTSSNNSLVPAPCPNLSEISLSTVDCFSNSSTQKKKPSSNSQFQSAYFNDVFDDTDVDRVREKTQLEFVSLPGGDTSHTISMSQRKEDEPGMSTSSDKKNERPTTSGDRKVEEIHSAPNLGDKEARDSMNRVERESKDSCPMPSNRKSSSADNKQLQGDAKRLEVGRSSGEPSTIREQFEMMFKDIRRQSKFPVHVPSPLRNYPNPEWSDSSLPTISGMSGTNIV